MIKEKAAVITGASRGIGNSIALKLAEEGYAVAIIGTSEEKAVKENLKNIEACNHPFIYYKGNIAERKDREGLMKEVKGKFGRLDVLVNNAGVAPRVRMDLLETTEESMDFVLNVNLKGTFFMTQLAANFMIEEMGSIEGIRPVIINISSVSAYTSSTSRGEYCISKAGLSMVTTLFADRLADVGINVYEIRPGVILTDMTAPVKEKYDRLIGEGVFPIKRWGCPEDIANAVSVLCSGKLRYSTGEVINVDGGFHIRRL